MQRLIKAPETQNKNAYSPTLIPACRKSSARFWCRRKRSWRCRRAVVKRTSGRKFFPGYVLVKMDMDENTWHLVKNVLNVTGFLGGPGMCARRRLPTRRRRRSWLAGAGRRGEAAAEIPVHARRAGARGRWPVPGLQRHRRGCELREEQAQGVGVHFRTHDAGGTGIQSGGEGLVTSSKQQVTSRKS